MKTFLTYTFDIFQQIQVPSIYTCAKYQHSSVTILPYVSIYITLSYSCAKCQHSSVTHGTYVSRYSDTLVVLMPNDSSPHLNMCHKSANRYTP